MASNTDQTFFSRVVAASTLPINSLSARNDDWKSQLESVQLASQHLVDLGEATQLDDAFIVYPHPNVPIEMIPAEWLYTDLLPDIQAKQYALTEDFKSSHPDWEEIDPRDIMEEVGNHNGLCRQLLTEFKFQRKAVHGSIPKLTAPPKSAQSHPNCAALQRAMQWGEGLTDYAPQVRMKQQETLVKQHNKWRQYQMRLRPQQPDSVAARATAAGTAPPSNNPRPTNPSTMQIDPAQPSAYATTGGAGMPGIQAQVRAPAARTQAAKNTTAVPKGAASSKTTSAKPTAASSIPSEVAGMAHAKHPMISYQSGFGPIPGQTGFPPSHQGNRPQ